MSIHGIQKPQIDPSSVQPVNQDITTAKPKERKKRVRKKSSIPLTQKRVQELFDYIPETGDLIRKCDIVGGKNSICFRKGDIAGSFSKSTGYRHVIVDGVSYLCHRIIWLHVNGYLPENQVDHISRDRLDNRWCNLREVTHTCNMRNRGMDIKNTSGVKGICWKEDRKKWHGQIRHKGKPMHLGFYEDFIDAVAARLAGEQCLDYPNCDSNSSAFLYMQAYVRGEDMQSYLKNLASK